MLHHSDVEVLVRPSVAIDLVSEGAACEEVVGDVVGNELVDDACTAVGVGDSVVFCFRSISRHVQTQTVDLILQSSWIRSLKVLGMTAS